MFNLNSVPAEFLALVAFAMIYGSLVLSWQTQWWRDSVRGELFGFLKATLDSCMALCLSTFGLYLAFQAAQLPSGPLWLGVWLSTSAFLVIRYIWVLNHEPEYWFQKGKAVRIVKRRDLASKLPLIAGQGYLPTR